MIYIKQKSDRTTIFIPRVGENIEYATIGDIKEINAKFDDYYTKDDINDEIEQLENQINSKQPIGNYLTSIPSEYITDSELATSLSEYVTDNELTSSLSEYVTDSELTTSLSEYATTTYVDNNIGNINIILENIIG
jgi:hypothetical protein